MNNNDYKLDRLLQNLSMQVPELKDPDILTESILNEVKNKSLRPTSPVLSWIRAVSGIAAIMLLGLFLFQQSDMEAIASTNKPTLQPETRINIDSMCIRNRNNKQVNLVETYFCHMEQNSIRNNLFRTYTHPLTN